MLKIDDILRSFNDAGADYILIGGMNFSLNHVFVNTFDVDVFISDLPDNHVRVTTAVRAMKAEWGPTEADWKPIPPDPAWLKRQSVFCLTTEFGAVDLFRSVRGLDDGYDACKSRACRRATATGISFWSLSDEDMLRCQLALSPQEQKLDRMRTLREAIARKPKP